MTNEHWVSIVDDGLRHAMKFNYSNNECFSHQFGYWCERAKKCVDLLNLSTTTRIEVLPLEGGRPSMKSRVISSQT
jgi:hypothetical protein